MLLGDAERWLPHFRSLSERLLDAIQEVWPACLAPLAPLKGSMTHEDPITDQLVLALIRSRRMPGRIVPQYSLLTERSDGTVHLSSHIDFVLTIGEDEDVYLACECKRLNVPFKSGRKALVREYVDDGLMRFVAGRYARGLPLAMMLGYVMDANLLSARTALHRAMSVRASTIGLAGALSWPPNHQARLVTRHVLADQAQIEIVHNLLPWP